MTMPRPPEIPDWMYPGTRIRDMHGQFWMIDGLQFRGREGHHAFLKPLGRGIAGWFPVDMVARTYHPTDVSRFPRIADVELLTLVWQGLVNVVPAQGGALTVESLDDVIVHNITNEVVEFPGVEFPPGVDVRVHCPGWDGIYMQLHEPEQRMVTFDGSSPTPYLVHEIQVGGGVRMVLEAQGWPELPASEPESTFATFVSVVSQGLRGSPPLAVEGQDLSTWPVEYEPGQVSIQTILDILRTPLDTALPLNLTFTREEFERLRTTVASSEDAAVWAEIERLCVPADPPPPEPVPEPFQGRRVSCWERIAAQRGQYKKEPDAILGGARTGRQAHLFDTTDDEDG